MTRRPLLPALQPGEPFPPASQAWPAGSPAPGLLASGGALDTATLRRAYSSGLFPWFGKGEPILWWSPDPRMVLQARAFRLHRSLRQTLRRFVGDPRCEIRIDSAFGDVIDACARVPRPGQAGTWIVPEMRAAYRGFHAAGHAHSVEVWIGGQLVAGLYCVSIGRAVFGESMFTTLTDGSKIALAALVAWCRHHDVPQVDCQQDTPHLQSLGAATMARAAFIDSMQALARAPQPPWIFKPVYWNNLMAPNSSHR